uniref:Uncharacterized protein n=1 Tax=Cacopsylla melanoneura TaxID=428564 RepID=A0A8D8W295_9HEMI
MEHGSDRSDDLLPRERRQHAGTARPSGQVREQNSDPYQDRAQLEDALEVPAGRVLHAQGARWTWYAVHGTRADTTVGSPLVETDRRRHHPLPVRYVPRRGPTDSQPVPVHSALGERVH